MSPSVISSTLINSTYDELAPFSSDKIRAKILDLGYGGARHHAGHPLIDEKIDPVCQQYITNTSEYFLKEHMLMTDCSACILQFVLIK